VGHFDAWKQPDTMPAADRTNACLDQTSHHGWSVELFLRGIIQKPQSCPQFVFVDQSGNPHANPLAEFLIEHRLDVFIWQFVRTDDD